MERIIHYCWFGGKPIPQKLLEYQETWRRFFPDYELQRWDESNFDIRCCRYVSEAYDAGKWAFVSDYCRFWALEKYGGLYFDTDVEIVRPFDELLELNGFTGFETENDVNPGLVLYLKEPHNEIFRKTIEWYEEHPFLDDHGERIRINVCGIFTGILRQYGFEPNGRLQECGGITVFPKDYFCPFDDTTGLLHKTQNTYTIHWYDKSWFSPSMRFRSRITRIFHRWFGVDCFAPFKTKGNGSFLGRNS